MSKLDQVSFSTEEKKKSTIKRTVALIVLVCCVVCTTILMVVGYKAGDYMIIVAGGCIGLIGLIVSHVLVPVDDQIA